MEERATSEMTAGPGPGPADFAEAAEKARRLGALARSAAEESLLAVQGAHPVQLQEEASGPKHVLLVEDDPVVSRLTESALTRHGYDVSLASNGLAGLRKARDESPDVVVLDLMLPGIDGFGILSRLRQEGHRTPVVICSCLTGEADRKTALHLGADEYLEKPASPSAVTDVVERLLASRKSPATTG